jgi:heme/copper-type cytochrome/quinol oxidase subunit 2
MNSQSAVFIFWVAVIACVVAQLGIFRAEFFRRGLSESSPGQQLTHSSRGIEILWSIIPAIALAAILTATWLALH